MLFDRKVLMYTDTYSSLQERVTPTSLKSGITAYSLKREYKRGLRWRIRGKIRGRIRGRIRGGARGRIEGRTHWHPARESHS